MQTRLTLTNQLDKVDALKDHITQDEDAPHVDEHIREYLRHIAAQGGRNGSAESKRKAVQARIDKYGQHMAQAIRESGLKESTVRWRLRRGWSEAKALSKPARGLKQAGKK